LVKTKGFDHIVWRAARDRVGVDVASDYFDVAALDVYNTGYTELELQHDAERRSRQAHRHRRMRIHALE
jgi:hypothetical protein